VIASKNPVLEKGKRFSEKRDKNITILRQILDHFCVSCDSSDLLALQYNACGRHYLFDKEHLSSISSSLASSFQKKKKKEEIKTT